MKVKNFNRTFIISIPIVVVVIILSAVVGNVLVNGQSSTQFGGPLQTAEPTYSLITTSSPSPKDEPNPDPSQILSDEKHGSGGSSTSRQGNQDPSFNPNLTDAQRACEAQMQEISAGSNRVGDAQTVAWRAYTSIQSELQAIYGNNPWSPEDTYRYEQARAETERTSAEVTEFWAQYPWQQWGCNENGLWHVP